MTGLYAERLDLWLRTYLGLLHKTTNLVDCPQHWQNILDLNRPLDYMESVNELYDYLAQTIYRQLLSYKRYYKLKPEKNQTYQAHLQRAQRLINSAKNNLKVFLCTYYNLSRHSSDSRLKNSQKAHVLLIMALYKNLDSLEKLKEATQTDFWQEYYFILN